MKVTAIIQARMGSSRLPGKVMLPLGGRPALYHVVSRACRASRLEEVVVATTILAQDDAIEKWCADAGVLCFRGDAEDVLRRYYMAARTHSADPVVRLTADCPLLDPDVIDTVVAAYDPEECDYLTNAMPPTYPNGVELEVFSFEALACAHRMARRPSEREHVTSFFLNNPEFFRLRNIAREDDLSAHRWTLDEPRDHEFLDRILTLLGEREGRLHEVIALLRQHPELSGINDSIARDEGYAKSLREDRLNGTGQALYRRAKARIPGGTQHLSKRPETHLPDQWPSYYSKAKGCEVWDLGGSRYLDFSINGIGANILGFADDDVDEAARGAIERGSNASLNCPEEVELADLLCELHPWAEMARFARCGGEAMAIAVRVARAATGRDKVAICGYHGWHDWYLAANLAEDRTLDGHVLPGLGSKGVPRGLTGTALPFAYNCPNELLEIAALQSSQLAAIIIEPIRTHQPDPGFLRTVQNVCARNGALLVVDEITMGFRLNGGGSHLLYDLSPDIAVFSKGLSNGYPMSAVIGRATVMQHAQECFISSTYWTERIGPAAALATVRKILRENVAPHLSWVGKRVKAGWADNARAAKIAIKISGIDPLARFDFLVPDARVVSTLFTQLMLDRGFLAGNCLCATWAHREENITRYLEAVADSFRVIADAISRGTALAKLGGPLADIFVSPETAN